jgi:hypothetical protein
MQVYHIRQDGRADDSHERYHCCFEQERNCCCGEQEKIFVTFQYHTPQVKNQKVSLHQSKNLGKFIPLHRTVKPMNLVVTKKP